MTTALTPGFAGIGAAQPSTDTRALSAINSRDKSFANKDFVKNIAWLNNSVDTLSAWSQKLQQGVDQANQNALEQVQQIWSDLFVMFAGLEPTGIEIGDVKYIIQGLGALLGINPETPFPINLLEAGWHLFSTYIVPGEQFTDVIFDAVDAWALEFGLPPEFIDSLHNLEDAFNNLWETIGTDLDGLFAALSKLLSAFMPSLDSLGELWDSTMELLDLVPWDLAAPVLNMLAELGTPFIDALTAIVNTGNAFLTPLSWISGSQVVTLGTNFVPPVSNKTSMWSVGAAGAEATAWTFDAGQSASGTDGSFTTLGSATSKEIHTQTTFPANPGGKIVVNGKLRWSGIPTGANDFGVQLQWYQDANPVSVTNLDIPAGHGATGGFSQSINGIVVTVPQNVNGVKLAARKGPGITTGQVWADDITAQLQGGIQTSAIDGLDDLLSTFLPLDFFNGIGGMVDPDQNQVAAFFNNLLPLDFFDDITGVDGIDFAGLADWFGGLLDGNSPIDALNLYNYVPSELLQYLPVQSVGSKILNVLLNPTFENTLSIPDQSVFQWDGTQRHSATGGSATTIANGITKDLLSDPLIEVDPGHVFNWTAWVQWTGLVGGASNPIVLGVNTYTYDAVNDVYNLDQSFELATKGSSGAASGWTQLVANSWTVPAGVDAVRMLLRVKPTATAGQVWFDDLFGGRTQKLAKSYVSELLELFDILGGMGTGLGSLLNIGNRLFPLNPNGTIDISQAVNMDNMPSIPNLLQKSLDFQTITDHINNALSGHSLVGDLMTGTGLDQAKGTMEQLFGNLTANTRKIQALETQQTAAATGGRQFNINFSDYPDGAFPAGLFNVAYSGAGTSRLGISKGQAVWNLAGNGAVTAKLTYPTPTLTGFQMVRGTMASPPEQGTNVRIWATARCNDPVNPTDYVWARGYCTGFLQYKGDIGCVVNGVETVWKSGVSLTWSLDMRLIAGVGNNPRRYQVLSGDTIVVDLTNGSGGFVDNSVYDANHQYWGSRTDTDGSHTPGAVAGASVVDNAPPAVRGTTFRASRRVGGDVTIAAGGTSVPPNFYETVDYISPDLTYRPGSNCELEVSKQGTYICMWRTFHGQFAAGTGGYGVLYIKRAGTTTFVPYERGTWGNHEFAVTFGVTTTLVDATTGMAVVALNPGDVIRMGFYFTNSMANTGDAATMADGSQAWMAVTGLVGAA